MRPFSFQIEFQSRIANAVPSYDQFIIGSPSSSVVLWSVLVGVSKYVTFTATVFVVVAPAHAIEHVVEITSAAVIVWVT